MAVSRKEILPESTTDATDIETWIDTELNKSHNQDIIKKYGVLVLVDYNNRSSDCYYESKTYQTSNLYDEIEKLYKSKGWKFDYSLCNGYTLIKLS